MLFSFFWHGFDFFFSRAFLASREICRAWAPIYSINETIATTNHDKSTGHYFFFLLAMSYVQLGDADRLSEKKRASCLKKFLAVARVEIVGSAFKTTKMRADDEYSKKRLNCLAKSQRSLSNY